MSGTRMLARCTIGVMLGLAFATAAPGVALASTGHAVYGFVDDVTTSWAGDPAPGVLVELSNGETATTSPDGSYRIEDVPDGAYTIAPAAEKRLFSPSSQSVTVAGADASVPVFTTGCSASGRIARPDGTGVAGVTVSWGGMKSDTTGDDGVWHLYGLRKQSYAFSASRQGGGFFSAVTTQPVAVNDNEAGIDFTTYRVVGRVVSAAGLPAANTRVSLSASGTEWKQVLTDANGYYVADYLQPLRYDVACSPFGITGLTFSPASRSATVGPDDARGADFVAVGERSITGRITSPSGAPVAGVSVGCAPWGSSAVTNVFGDYAIGDVPDGTWTVLPRKAKYSLSPSQTTASVQGAGVGSVDFTARPVIRTALKTSGTAHASVGNVWRLRGKLTPAASNDFVTFTLQRRVGGTWRTTRTGWMPIFDGQLEYAIRPAHTGRYRVTLRYAGRLSARYAYRSSSAAREFTVR